MAGRGTSRSGKGNESFRLTFDPPLAELDRMLKEVGEKGVDFTPVWPRMVNEVMAPGVRGAFSSHGASLGESWRPLSRNYDRRKHGGEILLKTGALRSSFETLKTTPRSVSYGTRIPYARATQYGIGHRRFVGWSSPMKAAAQKLMADYQAKVVQDAVQRLAAKQKAAG